MDRYNQDLEQDVRDAHAELGDLSEHSALRSGDHDRLYRDNDRKRETTEELYARTNPPKEILDDDELRQRLHDDKIKLEDDRPEPDTIEDVEAKYARNFPLHVVDGKYKPPSVEAEWEFAAAKAYAETARDAQDKQDEASFPDYNAEIVSQMYAAEQGLRDPNRRAETIVGLAQHKGIDIGQAYRDVVTVARAVHGLTPEAQRLAMHRLFADTGLFEFMAKSQNIPKAIGRAERKLLGFDHGKAAEKIEQGKALDIGDGDLQLQHAHLLTRKKGGVGKSAYEKDLENDVRKALASEGARRRDDMGRFVRDNRSVAKNPEGDVRAAFDEVAAKRHRPTIEGLRKVARESGTTLAAAMSRYGAFDAVLEHPHLGAAGLVHAWTNAGGSLGELAHVLHAAGGAELALRQQHRQRLTSTLAAPQRSGPTAADRQREAAARAQAASRSITGSANSGYSDPGGPRRGTNLSASGRHAADIDEAARAAYARLMGHQ